MSHHNRNQINDFSSTPDNLAASLTEENIATACSFVEKTAKLLLGIKFKKNLLKLQNLYDSSRYISWFLQDITVKSDRLILFDDSKYFPYCSIPMPIEHYWHKALAQAKSLVEHEKVDYSGIYEDNPTFFKKVDCVYLKRQGITLITKARDHIENHRIDEAIECYYRAFEFFKKANAEDLLNKYESELRRLKLNKYKTSHGNIDKTFDRCLFEILRSLRNKLAKGKPHYNVLPNESLKAMATSFPQDMENFKKIHGIGEEYEIYELFLEKIVTYCRVNNIEQETSSERYYPTELQETLELCKQSLTLEEIAQKRNLEVSTIIGHIEELILCGAKISIDKFVNANKQEQIMSVISKIGCEKLSPIKKMLGDAFTFEEIRLVRAYKIRNYK